MYLQVGTTQRIHKISQFTDYETDFALIRQNKVAIPNVTTEEIREEREGEEEKKSLCQINRYFEKNVDSWWQAGKGIKESKLIDVDG